VESAESPEPIDSVESAESAVAGSAPDADIGVVVVVPEDSSGRAVVSVVDALIGEESGHPDRLDRASMSHRKRRL
jgi:hypothetical protein